MPPTDRHQRTSTPPLDSLSPAGSRPSWAGASCARRDTWAPATSTADSAHTAYGCRNRRCLGSSRPTARESRVTALRQAEIAHRPTPPRSASRPKDKNGPALSSFTSPGLRSSRRSTQGSDGAGINAVSSAPGGGSGGGGRAWCRRRPAGPDGGSLPRPSECLDSTQPSICQRFPGYPHPRFFAKSARLSRRFTGRYCSSLLNSGLRRQPTK